MKRGSWSVESTIRLVFTIVIAVIVAMVLAVIGLTAYAVTTPAPEQTIIQRVETGGYDDEANKTKPSTKGGGHVSKQPV